MKQFKGWVCRAALNSGEDRERLILNVELFQSHILVLVLFIFRHPGFSHSGILILVHGDGRVVVKSLRCKHLGQVALAAGGLL